VGLAFGIEVQDCGAGFLDGIIGEAVGPEAAGVAEGDGRGGELGIEPAAGATDEGVEGDLRPCCMQKASRCWRRT